MPLSLAFLKVVVRNLSIIESSLIVLSHQCQVNQISELQLLLIHFEIFPQAVILSPLRLLPKVFELVLNTFASVCNTNL